jgi:hypothetical protein
VEFYAAVATKIVCDDGDNVACVDAKKVQLATDNDKGVCLFFSLSSISI